MGFRCSADSLGNVVFSSVSQSIPSLCCAPLPASLKLFGLLHDASEAYLADLPRPVKAGLPEYKAIEANVERVIAEKFVLPFPMPPEVKAAAQALLKDEGFSFFGTQRYFEDFGEEYWGRGAVPLFRLSPQIAESRFLYLYRSLSSAMSRQPRRCRAALVKNTLRLAHRFGGSC